MSYLETRVTITSKIEEVQKLIKNSSKDPNLHNYLGTLFERANRYDLAIESYKNAIRCDEKFVKAYNNIGVILYKQKRFKQAVEIFKLSQKADDKFVSTYVNLGAACNSSKLYDEGINALLKAIELDPTNSGAYGNLGNIYNKIKEHEKALKAHKKALKLDEKSATNHANIGITYKNLNRYNEAKKSLLHAIKIDPSFTNAHFDLATTYLMLGDYKKGFYEYEWRFKKEQMSSLLRDMSEVFKKPKFTLKSKKKDKTLLLFSEQGYGDMIQFARFAKLLKSKYPTLKLKILVRDELKSLFEEQNYFDEVISRGENLGEFDYHLALMSIPNLLKITTKNLPKEKSYIKVDGKSDLNVNKDKLNIGVVWSASVTSESYEGRVFGLDYFKPLMDDKNIELYSLQVGDSKDIKNYTDEQIIDLEDKLKSFRDSALVIKELDLVITSDTSVAHLAGSLGKECWVMLQKDAEWRWGVEKSKSIWYPTIKMIRQEKQGDWDSAFKKLYKDIQKRVK
jgi:Tfp pilus assembly protein PilF